MEFQDHPESVCTQRQPKKFGGRIQSISMENGGVAGHPHRKLKMMAQRHNERSNQHIHVKITQRTYTVLHNKL